jgi:hypothetical protein
MLLALALYIGGQMTDPDHAYAAIDPTSCTDMANYCLGIDPNADVGPNSCNAVGACQDFSGSIGEGSCNGLDACRFAGDLGGSAEIGDGSCNGDFACYAAGELGSAVIGDLSCLGENACRVAGNDGSATIGNGSCSSESACISVGQNGEATIGSVSCLLFQSCHEVGLRGNATIGDASCVEVRSCETAGYEGNAAIGGGSCNDQYACFAVGWGGDGTIGDQSCNDFEACYGVGASSGPGSVGHGSCNGYQSCKYFAYQGPSGSIGNVSCNSEQACYGSWGNVGDGSCNNIQTCCEEGEPFCSGLDLDVGDCENNNNTPPGCNVEVTKSANPTSIPETGDTPVTYTVRIDFLEDEDLNWVEDDQFASLGLNPGTYCTLYEDDGTNLGPISLPSLFIIDQYIICTYTYEPPPGEAGDTHDNVFTANVGHPDCPEEPEGPTGAIGPTDHECGPVGPAAILPGEVPGTNDVTAEASVLYLEVLEPGPTPDTGRDPVRPRPPNIGAGLSGLFNGMPTPLPTAPSAVAPSTTIRPPNTGDGGVRDGNGVVDRGFIIGAAAILTFTGIAIARRRA